MERAYFCESRGILEESKRFKRRPLEIRRRPAEHRMPSRSVEGLSLTPIPLRLPVAALFAAGRPARSQRYYKLRI